jgi:WD40 repeat protein
MKPLSIASDGKTLFHSTRENTVDVWDLETGIHLASCPGALVGAAQDGRYLITTASDRPRAWSSMDGAECEIASLPASQFAFHQRTLMTASRFKLNLELRDVFDPTVHRVVHVDHDPRYYPELDSWALAPDDRSLALTLAGEVAGQNWSSGMCVDLQDGSRRFKFKVNHHERPTPINFSREHHTLLVSDEIYHLAMLDLETGRPIREVWVSGFVNVAVASSLDPYLVLVNIWEPASAPAVSPFSIQALNLSRLSGAHIQRATVEAVFYEPQAIHDLLCAPDGFHIASLLANGVIHWWNLSTGEVEHTLET